MTANIATTLTAGDRGALKISAWLAIVLGVVAILSPFYAGIAATLLLGSYFLVGGIIEGIVAFRAASWLGTIGLIALAVVSVVAGLFILLNPLAGLVTLTVVSIASIFVVGLAKLFWSLRVTRGRGVLALSGVLSVLIAILLYANFPSTAAWTFGLLVGINLLTEGALMLGFLKSDA